MPRLRNAPVPAQIEIIEPHGFCMGVKAAITRASNALDAAGGGSIYCLHELVHNEKVVGDLEKRGMIFVTALAEVPRGATVLFSAHGVSPEIRAEAESRALNVIDATCSFVARVHRTVRDFAAASRVVIVVGNARHAEVRGVVGEAVDAGAQVFVVEKAADVQSLEIDSGVPVGVVCQTTLAGELVTAVVAALREKFSDVAVSAAADVCTATRDRQSAVRKFVRAGGDGVLVIGSAQSSNTRRLAEIAEASGARAWRIGDVAQLAECDFSSVKKLGITSGASTPESLLREIVAEYLVTCHSKCYQGSSIYFDK